MATEPPDDTDAQEHAIRRDQQDARKALGKGGEALVSALLGSGIAYATKDPGQGIAAAALAQGSLATLVSAWGSLRERLCERAAAEAFENLSERAPEIEANLIALREHSDGAWGTPADVTAVVELYLDAWRQAADRRAREAVENAAVNAFDPKRYEEGLNRVLFEILGRIGYGEIEALRELIEGEGSTSTGETTLRAFHLRRLVDEHLAFTKYPDGSGVRPTELGHRLIALIAESGLT